MEFKNVDLEVEYWSLLRSVMIQIIILMMDVLELARSKQVMNVLRKALSVFQSVRMEI